MTNLIYLIPKGNTNQAPDKWQKLFENNKKVAKHTEEKNHESVSRSIVLSQIGFHSVHAAQANYVTRSPISQ